MQNNNTIKLLKLQGKNIKINKDFIDTKNNTAYFYISKNIVATPLKDIESVSKNKISKLEEKLNYAFEISIELKYGYQLYQSFLKIKDSKSYKEKCSKFKDWLSDAESCTIPKFKSAAQTLLIWHKKILNSFKYDYTNNNAENKMLNNLNKLEEMKQMGIIT